MATTTGQGSGVKRVAVQAAVEAEAPAAGAAEQVIREQVEELARAGGPADAAGGVGGRGERLPGAGLVRALYSRRACGG